MTYLIEFPQYRFVIAFLLVALCSPYARGEQISNDLKSSLLKGYMLTCVPNISKQAPYISRKSAEAYCSCVGGKTFENFTRQQYSYLNSTRMLPPEIEARRNSWRNQCESKLN